MASPAGSDSNSFEDAENGNAGGAGPEVVTGNLIDLEGSAAGEALAVEEPAQNRDPSRPYMQLLTHAVCQHMDSAHITDGGAEGQNPDGSKRQCTSPSAAAPAVSTSPPAENKAPTLDRPPLSPPKGAAPPVGMDGASNKVAEAVVAVGVANVDMDTSSLVMGAPQVIDEAVAPGSDVASGGRCCGRCCRCCQGLGYRSWSAIIIGSLAALAAILCVIYFLLTPVFEHRIHEALVLRPSMENWTHPPVHMTAALYFFHLTNPEEFLGKGATPILKEMGPYAYDLDLEKINVTWNSNDTVSYRERYSFQFNSNRTNGTEQDIVRTVNIPLELLRNKMGIFAKLVEPVLSHLLSQDAVRQVESHTVGELVWGYENPLLQEINHLASSHASLRSIGAMPTDLGILTQEGADVSEMLNVYTGAENFSRVDDIYSWNYYRKLPYWYTDAANEIRGTDGSVFKPSIKKTSELSFFYAQLFRSFDLEYQRTRWTRDLRALRFIIPDSQFSNTTAAARPSDFKDDDDDTNGDVATSTTLPPNDITLDGMTSETTSETASAPSQNMTTAGELAPEDVVGHEKPDAPKGSHVPQISGFCVPNCVPNGAYSIEACTQAPLYISLPHFLGADPSYLADVSGLEPSEDLHRPVWDIDDLTGVTISNHRRHQVNLKITSNYGGKEIILPLMWLDLQIELGEEPMERLKAAHRTKLILSFIAVAAVCVITALFTVTMIFIFCYSYRSGSRYRPVPEEPEMILPPEFTSCLCRPCDCGINRNSDNTSASGLPGVPQLRDAAEAGGDL